MKQLTYSALALARLRGNRRQYRSLVLGIFLAIFLAASLVLGMYGVYLAFWEKRCDQVGYLDMVMLDNPDIDDGDLQQTGLFRSLGHSYVAGKVSDRNLYLGYYDQAGLELLNLKPLEGRLPEAPGELAMEASALDVLEGSWNLGDTLELEILPIDGTAEKRTYTLVGFLPERSQNLAYNDAPYLGQFPALVTSAQEPGFAVGRLAVHRLMTLASGVTLDDALDAIWHYGNEMFLIQYVYGLSITGTQRQTFGVGSAYEANREIFDLMFMASILALALILCCGLGISGAMEGLLSKRQEEIGVFRALGATRRQIRRMFGRESWILALGISPVSLGAGCLGVWLLSLALPERLAFGFRLWLLLPIGGFSMVVILLSGYLPLVRASRQMPMGVLRDTAMLRRSKGLRAKTRFCPTRLICARQIRFYPSRHLGASVLVGVMLLCCGLFTVLSSTYGNYVSRSQAAFSLSCGPIYHSGSYVNIYENPSLDQRSIAQIRSLDHVESVRIVRNLSVLAVLDTIPSYATLMDIGYENLGMLDDSLYRQFLLNAPDMVDDQRRAELRAEYLNLLDTYHISGHAFSINVTTIELSQENLETLSQCLSSGAIDVKAIQEGRQVLVLAPKVWSIQYDTGGYTMWTSEEDGTKEGGTLTAWNNCFTVGQALPLLHLYEDRDSGDVVRQDADVTIGGILFADGGFSTGWDHTCIITTEEGLENMCFLMEGLHYLSVYTDDALTPEDEETLEQQLTAISRRTSGVTVSNNLAVWRESQREDQQTIALVAALATVFFAVSVGMIVSAITRQLGSQGRTIGMLRAVGADQKTILGIYSGQITASVVTGLAISVFLMALYVLLPAMLRGFADFSIFGSDMVILGAALGAICATAAVCYLACRFFLGLRVREIIRRSIIDNIREL